MVVQLNFQNLAKETFPQLSRSEIKILVYLDVHTGLTEKPLLPEKPLMKPPQATNREFSPAKHPDRCFLAAIIFVSKC